MFFCSESCFTDYFIYKFNYSILVLIVIIFCIISIVIIFTKSYSLLKLLDHMESIIESETHLINQNNSSINIIESSLLIRDGPVREDCCVVNVLWHCVVQHCNLLSIEPKIYKFSLIYTFVNKYIRSFDTTVELASLMEMRKSFQDLIYPIFYQVKAV